MSECECRKALEEITKIRCGCPNGQHGMHKFPCSIVLAEEALSAPCPCEHLVEGGDNEERLTADLAASQERERLLREALQPFAAHYIRMMELLMEPNGYSYMNERIKDWFGVSDFKTAAALATPEGTKEKP